MAKFVRFTDLTGEQFALNVDHIRRVAVQNNDRDVHPRFIEPHTKQAPAKMLVLLTEGAPIFVVPVADNGQLEAIQEDEALLLDWFTAYVNSAAR